MKAETQSNALGAVWFFRSIAVWGPGLLVMLADTDAGNVVTAAQSGAQWGYRLLSLVLLLIPMLYMVQELTVRLGIYTGRGHGELIRIRFGVGWARLSTLGLAGAVVGSLITEFTGVAGVGELFGLSRGFTLPLAAATLLFIVASGSYKRVERVALIIGLFELACFVVAWAAHPGLAGAGAGRNRFADRQSRFSVHGRGDHRRDLQPMDDLLPAVGDGREETQPRRSRPRSMGHRRRRDSDPMPHRRGAGRRRGGVRQRRGLFEPLDGWGNQRRADPSFGRGDRADCVQRRGARGVAGRGDRRLSSAGLGRRRSRRLSPFARISAIRRSLVLWRLCGLRPRLGRGRVVRLQPRLA